jgi:hypothetical protein
MTNWIEEMIEREAIPRNLRKETVEEFAIQYGIDPSTYYYHSRKKENQKKVLNIALSLAKKGIPDVLEKLRDKAESGDTKAMEMYLKYILEMRDKYDMTSDDKELKAITGFNYIIPNGEDNADNKTSTQAEPSLE